MSHATITAVAASLIALGILWLGRRDVTRPYVAFGVTWFGFVALAQARLTDLERPWSTGFTLLALGGGLVLTLAALLAAGTAPARGTIRLRREEVNARRLIAVAAVLIAGGAIGAAYKAHVLGGIPLFSGDPDVVRGRAIQAGESAIPAWSSALTGGFYIGMWAALAAGWVLRPRVSRMRLLPLGLLAAAGLLGVALEASRNLVLFAIVVPALGAYLLRPPGRERAQAAWAVAAVGVLAFGVGGLFALRTARGETRAGTYISQEMDKQPRLVRPLVPLYVNGVYPLEAARRLYEVVPQQIPYDVGGASLTSFPDKFFPEGKSRYGLHLAALMTPPEGVAGLTWSVGSYQGRLIADLGWRGVLLGSLLIGLAAGALYRWARGRAGFLPVALIAYVAYDSAFMVYDNALSFSLISIYDLFVVALMSAYCLGWTDDAVAALRQLGRRLLAE